MNFQDVGKNFLEHYGIKGMRWGVRRTDAQLERASGESSNNTDTTPAGGKAPDSKTATKGRNPNDLTDKELQQVVNRINMEQQYARLTYSPSIVERGAKFAGDIAVNVAKTQLTKAANDRAANVIGRGLFQKASIPAPPNRFPSAPPLAKDRVG